MASSCLFFVHSGSLKLANQEPSVGMELLYSITVLYYISWLNHGRQVHFVVTFLVNLVVWHLRKFNSLGEEKDFFKGFVSHLRK